MRERRRTFTGRVVSNKMQKTVVVLVERTRRHPLYGKVMRVSNRFKAHTEQALDTGDLVKIVEARPLSKDKRWVVAEVLQHGEILSVPEVELPPTKTEKPNERAEAAVEPAGGAPQAFGSGADTAGSAVPAAAEGASQ
jgi:small subunit ribosomal protein S17